MTETLEVDLPKALWLSSNRPPRVLAYRARIVRAIHDLTTAAAHAQHLAPVTGPYVADWTIHYPKGVSFVHGDAANAHPTCKAILDALVPDWLAGDGPRHVAQERYARGVNLDVQGVHRVALVLRRPGGEG